MKGSVDSSKHVIGVDDGSFIPLSRSSHSHTILCCVEMYGSWIERVQISNVEVDGFDATDRLLSMIGGSKAEAVILSGITFAGFNIVDPHRILEGTGIPVIIYTGKRPDNQSMLHALKKHFEDWERRWRIIEELEDVHEISTREKEPVAFFEVVGRSSAWAVEVLRHSAIVCRIPEPVRVAGLIARGLSHVFCRHQA